MRTFLALWIPPRLVDEVMGVVRKVRNDPRAQAPIRWVRPESMHLTVQFFGEISEPVVAAIDDTLCAMEVQAFRIDLQGVGFFPRGSAPRVFWAGVHSEGFSELATRIRKRTQALGFEAPAHPPKPHLTLARAKGRSRFDKAFVELAGGFRDYDFGSATLDRMVLLESRLSENGAEYSEIASYRFEEPSETP